MRFIRTEEGERVGQFIGGTPALLEVWKLTIVDLSLPGVTGSRLKSCWSDRGILIGVPTVQVWEAGAGGSDGAEDV